MTAKIPPGSEGASRRNVAGMRCRALRMKEHDKGDACGHDDPRQGNDEAEVAKNNDGSLFVDLFHQALHVLQA